MLSLAINARDVMPAGGRLEIATRNVQDDGELDARPMDLRAAAFAMIAVATDVGMSQEVQARIFEPFFTTKPAGQGTGLGLSTVFGIVRQSDGDVRVSSEPGCGTTVQIYLPAVNQEATTSAG